MLACPDRADSNSNNVIVGTKNAVAPKTDVWPGWENWPTPSRVLGDRGFRAIAEKLVHAAMLEDKKLGGFHQMLFGIIRDAVEREYGRDAGTKLGRIKPLVDAFGYGECNDTTVLGKGRRIITACIENLNPEQPFHETSEYSWCAQLAAEAAVICHELREQREPVERDWVGAPDGTWGTMDAPEWRALGLVQGCEWVAENRFPKTRAILNSLPGMFLDEAMFARMPPGTRIGPHSDNMNFLLVAHLGLEVEESVCALDVGDWTRQWREGEVLIFDHTFVHSAANRSARDRYVLICRFWHPGLSAEEWYAVQFLLRAIAEMKKCGNQSLEDSD